jgi:flagellar biosynthetic protein FlhB
MADQQSDNRTLPATPKKLGKAREQGQVVRSKELAHLVTIGVAGTLLVTMGPVMTDWMQQTVVLGLSFNRETMQNTGMMNRRLAEMALRMLWVVIPFCAVMMAAGIGATLAIGGWNFTLKPLVPAFGKFNPILGFMNLLSKAKLIDAMKASVLAIILGVIGAFYLKNHFEEFGAVLGMPLPSGLQQSLASVLGGLWLLLVALSLFAAIDVPLQKHNFAERLKMSHAEVKQEQKEANGSQEIKTKIRSKMREITKRRMLAAVPKADLVVMNPTHYAVALKYDEAKMGAPRVVAKGADLLAMTIRDLAKEHKVPVLQAPVLARALFAHTELDHEIPAALFAAVAQVLAYVYQLRAAISGKAPMPMAFPELTVPPELDPHNKPVEGLEDFIE